MSTRYGGKRPPPSFGEVVGFVLVLISVAMCVAAILGWPL